MTSGVITPRQLLSVLLRAFGFLVRRLAWCAGDLPVLPCDRNKRCSAVLTVLTKTFLLTAPEY